MCVNKQRFDGDVWHINMRYIYSYIIIYVYIHVCRRMEAVENSPKAYVGFVRVLRICAFEFVSTRLVCFSNNA